MKAGCIDGLVDAVAGWAVNVVIRGMARQARRRWPYQKPVQLTVVVLDGGDLGESFMESLPNSAEVERYHARTTLTAGGVSQGELD